MDCNERIVTHTLFHYNEFIVTQKFLDYNEFIEFIYHYYSIICGLQSTHYNPKFYGLQ